MNKNFKNMKMNFDRWVYNANVCSFLLWAALIGDIVYAVMFLIMAEYLFFIIGVAKIVYIVSLIVQSKNLQDSTNVNMAKMLSFGVVIYVYCTMATLVYGLGSGFNMVLLGIIPAVFFTEYLIRNSSEWSYIASAVIGGTNILLVLVDDRFVRNGVFNDVERIIIQCFNWALAVFLVVFTAIVFMAEVFNISNGLARQNKKLNELANYDPLTGLLLRRPMSEKIDECVGVKKDYGRDYAICIGDIDHFKNFNDTYGHDCGDAVLKTVAQLINEGAGEENYVCRWGGEEIMILFPDKTVYDAVKIVEQIRTTIEKKVINYKDEEVHVTVTFGVSSSEKHIMSQEVIEAADMSLYTGKTTGRNKVCSD